MLSIRGYVEDDVFIKKILGFTIIKEIHRWPKRFHMKFNAV